MRNNKITHLVTHVSGEAQETYASIYACRVLNIPIIMIGRENDDAAESSSIETIKTNLLVHFGLNK